MCFFYFLIQLTAGALVVDSLVQGGPAWETSSSGGLQVCCFQLSAKTFLYWRFWVLSYFFHSVLPFNIFTNHRHSQALIPHRNTSRNRRYDGPLMGRKRIVMLSFQSYFHGFLNG